MLSYELAESDLPLTCMRRSLIFGWFRTFLASAAVEVVTGFFFLIGILTCGFTIVGGVLGVTPQDAVIAAIEAMARDLMMVFMCVFVFSLVVSIFGYGADYL